MSRINRISTLALAGLVLLAAGFLAGRWSGSQPAPFQARPLPGDRGLEAAWQNLLAQQQASLAMLKDSDFYGDDQERAEAYLALVTDLAAAIAGDSPVEPEGPLLGRLPEREQPEQPLTPNGMAALLEQVTARLKARSEVRLETAAQAFLGAEADSGRLRQSGGDGFYLAHWKLDNEEGLLIEFPGAESGEASVALANVWAMGLPVGQSRLDCSTVEGCRGIISHRDTGQPGWLDTGGHRRGLLVLRRRNGGAPPVAEEVVLGYRDGGADDRRGQMPSDPDSTE